MNIKRLHTSISNVRKMNIIVVNTLVLLTAEHFLVVE